jgi:hypothetical protein
MSQIAVQPRPDIALTIIQDQPNLSNGFIANQVFPTFPVGVSTAPIPRILRRSKLERLYRPRYGAFPRGQSEVVSAGTYNCQEQGFEEAYDAKDCEIHRGESQCQATLGAMAMRNVLLAHEVGVANSLMTTATFGSGFNAAAAAVWGSASDKPLHDVADAKQANLLSCGNEGNTVILGAGLYTKLKKSPQMQTQGRAVLGYTSSKGIEVDLDPKLLATIFGVEKVLIGRATIDTADEGQTSTLGFVWPSDKALVAYIPNPNEELAPHLGRTFVWDSGLMEFGGQTQMPSEYEGFVLETYGDVPRNTGVVRARKYLDTLLLNKDSGFLITGC